MLTLINKCGIIYSHWRYTSSSSSSSVQTEIPAPAPTTTTTSGQQTIIEYEEPIDAPLTNEQIVDAYINSLEQSTNEDTGKVLTK